MIMFGICIHWLCSPHAVSLAHPRYLDCIHAVLLSYLLGKADALHMCWSYWVCIDQLHSTYSWLPAPALHHAHPPISLQDFLNESMRDSSKSERLSQMPIWKMAWKGITTVGSVIPFNILQCYHLTGRSSDRDT